MNIWKVFRPFLIRYVNGYRQFFDHIRGRWEFTHRRVAEKFFGRIPADHEVHHIDSSKQNNRPENLQVLTREEHRARHHADGERAPNDQPSGTCETSESIEAKLAKIEELIQTIQARSKPVTAPASRANKSASAFYTQLGRIEVQRILAQASMSRGGCPRCGGSGYLPEFSHVAGGVCFCCGGSGGDSYHHDDPPDDYHDFPDDDFGDDGDPRFDEPEPIPYDDGFDYCGYDDDYS